MSVSTLYIPGNAVAVTKSDTTRLSCVGFYVGVGGDVAVMPWEQESAASPTAVTFKAVATGTQILLNISRIMSTNTTATNIIAYLQ